MKSMTPPWVVGGFVAAGCLAVEGEKCVNRNAVSDLITFLGQSDFLFLEESALGGFAQT